MINATLAKEMIDAVRSDTLVGRGSCSVIDETLTGDELLEAVVANGATTAEMAVEIARSIHEDWANINEDMCGW